MTFMRPPANKTAVIDFPTTYCNNLPRICTPQPLPTVYLYITQEHNRNIKKNRHSEISPKEQQQQNYEGHKSLTE